VSKGNKKAPVMTAEEILRDVAEHFTSGLHASVRDDLEAGERWNAVPTEVQERLAKVAAECMFAWMVELRQHGLDVAITLRMKPVGVKDVIDFSEAWKKS